MSRNLCRCRQGGSQLHLEGPICLKAKVRFSVKDLESDGSLLHKYAFCHLQPTSPELLSPISTINHIISTLERIVFTDHLSSIFDSGSYLKYSSLPPLSQPFLLSLWSGLTCCSFLEASHNPRREFPITTMEVSSTTNGSFLQTLGKNSVTLWKHPTTPALLFHLEQILQTLPLRALGTLHSN